MTGSDSKGDSTSALVAEEIAVEQTHVDRVYAELVKAGARAGLVEADKINPRHWPPDSSAIDPTTGGNASVSTHDNGGI